MAIGQKPCSSGWLRCQACLPEATTHGCVRWTSATCLICGYRWAHWHSLWWTGGTTLWWTWGTTLWWTWGWWHHASFRRARGWWHHIFILDIGLCLLCNIIRQKCQQLVQRCDAACDFHHLVSIYTLAQVSKETLTLVADELDDCLELIAVGECFNCLLDGWFRQRCHWLLLKLLLLGLFLWHALHLDFYLDIASLALFLAVSVSVVAAAISFTFHKITCVFSCRFQTWRLRLPACGFLPAVLSLVLQGCDQRAECLLCTRP